MVDNRKLRKSKSNCGNICLRGLKHDKYNNIFNTLQEESMDSQSNKAEEST